MLGPPRVKICCISSVEEAELAIAMGASALGLVSSMPSGPGVIDERLIAEIVVSVPPPIATFLLTAEQDAEAILEQHRLCQTNTIQLVDEVSIRELKRLRSKLKGTKLVQVVHVVHVVDERSIDQAIEMSQLVDGILLDSGNPGLEVKELGGTGRTHNWQLSRKIRESIDIPVFLAGGLNVDNVSEAMQAVDPFGLDLCSGVRSDDRLDAGKLRAFMRAIAASVTRR